MNVSIYINNRWTNITDKIDPNFQNEARCDEVFSVGTMKAWLDIPYNIPPYTLLMIGEDYYLCSSQSTRYMTYENLYVHDITILEATAILSCYILGSKSFSVTGTNKTDVEKIKIISSLMKQKYNVTLDYNVEEFRQYNKEQEFTFGLGTTVYDALLAIAKTYNCVPKVNQIDFIGNEKVPYVEIYFLKLGDDNPYPLNEENITNEICTQNVDNYCKTLEAEMSNVIDRTDKVLYEGLTTRSDDLEMTDKTAKLFLPTRIEEVKEFYVINNIELQTYDSTTAMYLKYQHYSIDQINNLMKDWYERGFIRKDSIMYYATYEEWRNLFKAEDEEGLYYPFDDLYENCLKINFENRTEFYNTEFIYNTGLTGQDNYFKLYLRSKEEIEGTKINISNRILSKAQYDILTLEDRPKYCYYTPGSNIIDGMMETYRNDIWNIILNKDVKPFLYYASVDEKYERKYGEYLEVKLNIALSISEFDVRKHTFNALVTTITNPFVKSEKTIIPINQNEYMPSSRSYDKGSNNIDFDKMIASLQKSNDMLGLPELSLEYDLGADGIIPQPGQKIAYKENNWYIASVITYYRTSRIYCIINLVSSFNKIADAIGVETQFNTTPNPLENIIERTVFYETKSNVVIPNNVWFRIGFKFRENSGNFNKTLFVRASVSKHDNVTYLFAETLDQYSFGRQTRDIYDKEANKYSNRFAVYDIGYVNEYNEVASYKIDVVKLPVLSIENSYKLPEYIGTYDTLISLPEQKLYKDAREKINFTIKITSDKEVKK